MKFLTNYRSCNCEWRDDYYKHSYAVCHCELLTNFFVKNKNSRIFKQMFAIHFGNYCNTNTKLFESNCYLAMKISLKNKKLFSVDPK
jgi:hypothetical protein